MAKVTYSLLEKAKSNLLAELRREICDERVLAAMAKVPREKFISADLRAFAYDNRPLPIGHGQTISQPLIVAMMTEALALKGNEKVLEVGTGSGYQAAILAELAARVVTVERIAALAEQAAAVLAELGYRNVEVHVAGETLGWPAEAPYEGIVVTAGAPEIPLALVEQLAADGRLVIPVGARDVQELLLVTKSAGGLDARRGGPCRFVALGGAGGW
ncbi:MAG: protein-L-isoaspartate(D-aspartate) O-methyltransferase, partial [Dehalococcoidia bacterium]